MAFLKALPRLVNVGGLTDYPNTAAALDVHHLAVGIARLVIPIDDIQDFLLGIILGMVEHLEQLTNVVASFHCRNR